MSACDFFFFTIEQGHDTIFLSTIKQAHKIVEAFDLEAGETFFLVITWELGNMMVEKKNCLLYHVIMTL